MLAKKSLIFWNFDMDQVRSWLLVEVTFFFFSISAGIGYLFLSSMLPDSGLFLRDHIKVAHEPFNPYNGKNTSDFLSYAKKEYFLFTFQATLVMTGIAIGFTDLYKFNHYGQKTASLKWAIVIAMVPHILKLTAVTWFKMSGTICPQQMRKLSKIQLVVQLFILILLVTLFNTSFGKLERENVVGVRWVYFEMIQSCIEPFFFAYSVFVRGLGLEKYNVMGKIMEDAEANVEEFENDMSPERAKEENGEQSQKEDSDHLDNLDLPEEHAFEHHYKKDEDNDKETASSEEGDATDLKKKILSAAMAQVKSAYEHASKKDKITFMRKDFIIMTSLCYLDKNVKKYHIVSSKRSQLFWSAVTANFVTTNILLCMLYALLSNEKDQYTPNIASTFPLFEVKFPCAMALHFLLFPEVKDALVIMKLAHQEPDQFVEGGALISFFLGFSRYINAVLCEGITIYMLSYQHTI